MDMKRMREGGEKGKEERRKGFGLFMGLSLHRLLFSLI